MQVSRILLRVVWLVGCIGALPHTALAQESEPALVAIQTKAVQPVLDGAARRLVVPSFKLLVHTKLNKTAQAKSGLFGSGKASAKSAMFTQWKDAEPQALQALADQSWQAFQLALTQAGWQVLPVDQLASTTAYQRISLDAAPAQDDKMLTLVPTGFKRYDPSGKIDPNGSFFLGMANLNSKLEVDAAREALGVAEPMVVARIVVNLAYGAFETEVTGSTAVASFDRDTASAKVAFIPVATIKTSAPTVTPQLTGVELLANFEATKLPDGTTFEVPKVHAQLALKDNLLGHKPVSRLVDVTTDGEKAAAGAVALLGALMGRGASLDAGQYDAHVDIPTFQAQAAAQINLLAGALSAKMKVQTSPSAPTDSLQRGSTALAAPDALPASSDAASASAPNAAADQTPLPPQ